jgi:alkylation response protein AidB-like acyl-CoA dehydrogenase
MTMSVTELLHELFAEREATAPQTPAEFLKTYGPPPAGTALPEDPFRRLVRVATHADRRATGSLAGHQASIRRLFPDTAADAICAFCISEERGPHPKYIDTALRRTGNEADGTWRLDGSKRWGSVAPDSDLLYVAASIGRDGDRNDLRMVAVPTDRAGVSLDLEPYRDYGPDMRIADITFDNVAVTSDEIIPGDAYLSYIKAFRLIEDVFNTAGSQIAMLRLAREHSRPHDQAETLVGLICQALAVSTTDMDSPEAIVLLSAYLRASAEFWDAAWASWPDAPQAVLDAWRPDRGLLDIAARARETRRQSAWDALGGSTSAQAQA